ncbi:uncharacterized protein LOC142340391 [Convolutriloba macropyga]|uniref:uncharacterized protein LOC142340391 n=1 Tax=Convolutriloba macropyga TaxID=536237 RepID=UPI003F5202BF
MRGDICDVMGDRYIRSQNERSIREPASQIHEVVSPMAEHDQRSIWFGWSVRTYAKLEDTHQEDFINMITVNLAQLVYGSPELFGMGIMDEFFRAHSKVDRVLQINLQPLIVSKELAYQYGLKEFGSYHFKTEE